MQLFKRVLLSIFPDDIVNQSVNPASMFISFISTKEFFSVINRKIVENYKLNLFDVTQDPFEFKIGFGENIPIKPKDVDLSSIRSKSVISTSNPLNESLSQLLSACT